MFLYGDPNTHAPAYFIIPADHPDFYAKCPNGENPKPERVEHQYGCVACRQFSVMGRIEPVEPELLALTLDASLGCHLGFGYAERECPGELEKMISRTIGLEVERAMGEGLIKLKDGRYVATQNCD